MNHTTDYIDICGTDPTVSDPSGAPNWERWFTWCNRIAKAKCWSNHRVSDGIIVYHPLLKSQVTRWFMEHGVWRGFPKRQVLLGERTSRLERIRRIRRK